MEILTAETAQGRSAIARVMRGSYTAEVESVPPQWVRALVVEGVPVSFVVVDPGRCMDHPEADLRYAFICDVATPEDRRGEGHCRRIMEHTFTSLRAVRIPLVVTHGPCSFLQGAAVWARRLGKARIMFEHPPAPSYGSPYPIYSSLETPFSVVARECGAQVRVQGADPEGSLIPHADWSRVLDPVAFLREAVSPLNASGYPEGKVAFDTEVGRVVLESREGSVRVSVGAGPGVDRISWPSSALAQLVTGYQSASLLGLVHGRPLSCEVVALLDVLFPRRWRLSRNESWTFGH